MAIHKYRNRSKRRRRRVAALYFAVATFLNIPGMYLDLSNVLNMGMLQSTMVIGPLTPMLRYAYNAFFSGILYPVRLLLVASYIGLWIDKGGLEENDRVFCCLFLLFQALVEACRTALNFLVVECHSHVLFSKLLQISHSYGLVDLFWLMMFPVWVLGKKSHWTKARTIIPFGLICMIFVGCVVVTIRIYTTLAFPASIASSFNFNNMSVYLLRAPDAATGTPDYNLSALYDRGPRLDDTRILFNVSSIMAARDKILLESGGGMVLSTGVANKSYFVRHLDQTFSSQTVFPCEQPDGFFYPEECNGTEALHFWFQFVDPLTKGHMGVLRYNFARFNEGKCVETSAGPLGGMFDLYYLNSVITKQNVFEENNWPIRKDLLEFCSPLPASPIYCRSVIVPGCEKFPQESTCKPDD